MVVQVAMGVTEAEMVGEPRAVETAGWVAMEVADIAAVAMEVTMGATEVTEV